MIIEDLIRLGRPLLEGGLAPAEVLELVSDVGDPKVKNFLRHVFVVELPPEGSNEKPVALPMQVWGQEVSAGVKSKKTDFQPDTKRAVGAPFVLPAGGNPLVPQGRYGAPVYPCWEAHLRTLPGKEKYSLAESPAHARGFLEGRLSRTPGAEWDERLDELSACVHRAVSGMAFDDRVLGLLILAQPSAPESPFEYADSPSERDLGQSVLAPGKYLVPRFGRLLEGVWAGKVAEGASKGTRPGCCSFCGGGEEAVSYYCKSWPWALPEWDCPLPQGGNDKLMAEGIALDEPCYRALTLGACVFAKLTRPVQALVTKELFAPVCDPEGRKTVQARSLSELPQIRGAAYVLPLHDSSLADEAMREEFVAGVQAMLAFPEKRGPLMERYLDAVTGFDVFLPEDVETEDYRLTLVYFHGEVTRGDPHLRAMIQDVLPPTLCRLRDVARETSKTASDLLVTINPSASEKQTNYYGVLYRSVPYLLARAYGGAYVWDQLECAVRRRPLDGRRPTANVARRMDALVPCYPDSFFDLNDEVIFYLSFRRFLADYAELVGGDSADATQERSTDMAMRPWEDLLGIVMEEPVDEIAFQSPAELGFACGALVRRFSRQYRAVTGNDYLKQRVLTFGTDLSPDTVWKRGLRQIFEVVPRYEQLRVSDDFFARLGAALHAFENMHEQVRADRDGFTCAFWAGHALQGARRERAGETESDADTASS